MAERCAEAELNAATKTIRRARIRMDYSARMAMMGSMRSARRAGR